jgi:hypothetical protein
VKLGIGVGAYFAAPLKYRTMVEAEPDLGSFARFAEPCLQQLYISKVKQSQYCESALIVAQVVLSKFWC